MYVPVLLERSRDKRWSCSKLERHFAIKVPFSLLRVCVLITRLITRFQNNYISTEIRY